MDRQTSLGGILGRCRFRPRVVQPNLPDHQHMLSGSHVQGDPAAITRTQRSSTRYYQRPDANHLNLDRNVATSLSGYYAVLTAAKQAGAVTGRVAMSATSPGYEVNDLGFQSYSDRIIIDTNFCLQSTGSGPDSKAVELPLESGRCMELCR